MLDTSGKSTSEFHVGCAPCDLTWCEHGTKHIASTSTIQVLSTTGKANLRLVLLGLPLRAARSRVVARLPAHHETSTSDVFAYLLHVTVDCDFENLVVDVVGGGMMERNKQFYDKRECHALVVLDPL